jgi:hypothetical protein
MRRLYYLADDLDTTRTISDRLHADGISDWNFHVLARDEGGLYTHHIHSALPHHHKDLIRSGEIGALYGAGAVFVCALIAALVTQWAWLSTWIDLLMVTLIGGAVGGLVGIRVGLSRDNLRLASFHSQIEVGKFLIMVDVHKRDKPIIRELMNMEFPQVEYHGNESTFVRPFKADERVIPKAVPHPIDGAVHASELES